MQVPCSTFSVIINAIRATHTTTGFGWLPVTEHSKWEAVIHACTQRSKVTCTPLPDWSTFLFKIKKKYGWILFDQATYTHTVLSSVVVVDRFPPAIPHHLHLCYKFQLVSPFVHTLLCDMTVPILCWKSLMDFCRLVCIKSISNGSLHTDACSMWSCHINTMAVTSQLTIQGKDYNKLTEVCLYFYLPMKSAMLPTRQRRKQNECPLLSASPMCLAYMTLKNMQYCNVIHIVTTDAL